MRAEALQRFRQILRQLEREVEHQLKADKACCGITLAQCHVLMELGAMGSTSISGLADRLKLDKSTLSRTVDRMVKMDLVKRSTAEADRRFMEVGLSSAGRSFFETLNHTCNDFYYQVFDRIPREKHEQVLESTRLLVEAMASAHERDEPEGCLR